MSGCCYTIYVRNIPGAVPAWVKDAQGNVRLELSDSAKYTRSKKVATITEFSNIGSEGVLGFALPKTDVNSYILGEFGRTSAFSFDNKTVVPVIVMEGARVLAEDFLRVLRVTNEGWEVELFRGESFWKNDLKFQRLCDLDFDTILLTPNRLIDNWFAPLGDVDYRFPLIDYGNWANPAVFSGGNPLGVVTTPGEAESSDFRPLFHVKELLEKSFCAIGWEFKSPILDTDFGKRLLAYILSDFNIPSEKYAFKAVVTQRHFGVSGLFLNPPPYNIANSAMKAFDDFDLGYDYGGTPGFYQASVTPLVGCSVITYFRSRGLSGTFRFRFRVTIDTTFDQTDRLLQFKVVQYGITTLPRYAPYFRVYPGETVTYEASITMDVNPDFCYEFWLDTDIDYPGALSVGPVIYSSTSGNGYFEILEGSEVWVEPVSIRFANNMILAPSTLINCVYSGLDILSGVMHLLGPGILQTDIASKTVTLYHKDDTILGNGEVPESYYLNELYAKELDEFLECEDYSANIRTGVEDRFLQLRYQKSEDKFIELSGFGDEIQPHQKDIDYGAGKGFNERLKVDENPFFHPTLMRECTSLWSPSGYGNVIIPVMWDNDEGKISYDIKPRILIWGDAIQQPGTLSGTNIIPRSWYWTTPDFEAQFIPFAYSQYDGQVGITTPQLVPYNLAYGDFPEYPFDLYTVFWRKSILEKYISFTYTLKAWLHAGSFDALSFRNLLHITYLGTPFLSRLVEVSNYDPCSGAATIVLEPVVYSPENCTVPQIPEFEEPIREETRVYEVLEDIDNSMSFLYYDPIDNSPATFFDSLLSQGLDVIVEGRDSVGSLVIYDSTLPDFLNTLTVIEPGRGYLVNISGSAPANFFNTGVVVQPPSYKINLVAGNNIVWYASPETLDVEVYFEDLILSGCLIEIVSRDSAGNTVVYDPLDPGSSTLLTVQFGGAYIVRCSCNVNANDW